MGWIEKINNSLTMQDVLEKYVGLPDRSKKYLCPFHKDKHPSLSINPKTGRFTCFACGERGDVIDFVQKLYNIDQREALLTLSRDFNLGIENHRDEPEAIRAERRRRELDKKREAELKERVIKQKQKLWATRRVVRDCISSNKKRYDEELKDFIANDKRATACMWAIYMEAWILWLEDCLDEYAYDDENEIVYAFDLWALGQMPTEFMCGCEKNNLKQRKLIVLEKLEKGELEPICNRNIMT